jgi:hypothetical protein
MTDWATATAPSGTTAYAFRRAHRIGLRIRFPGGRLGRPLVVSHATTYPSTPQVSLAGDGTGVVAWAVPRGAGVSWRVREFDVHGRLGRTRSPVAARIASRDLRAVALLGGRTLVTWNRSARHRRGAYVSLLTPRFATSPVFSLGSAAGSAAPWVMSGPRRATLVWTDGQAMVGSRLDVHGVPAPRRVLPGTFPRNRLTLSAEATDSSGVGVFVGSVRQHGVNQAFVMRVKPGVRFAQPPIPVSPPSEDVGVNDELLAVGAGGGGVVAWYDGVSGASYASALGADGGIFSPTRFRAAVVSVAVRADGDGAVVTHATKRRHPLRLVHVRHGVFSPAAD